MDVKIGPRRVRPYFLNTSSSMNLALTPHYSALACSEREKAYVTPCPS